MGMVVTRKRRKLKIRMIDGLKYELPLNQRTEINFKYDRIQFTQYEAVIGHRPYDLPENYYYEDIENWKWEGF